MTRIRQSHTRTIPHTQASSHNLVLLMNCASRCESMYAGWRSTMPLEKQLSVLFVLRSRFHVESVFERGRRRQRGKTDKRKGQKNVQVVNVKDQGGCFCLLAVGIAFNCAHLPYRAPFQCCWGPYHKGADKRTVWRDLWEIWILHYIDMIFWGVDE